MSVVLGSDLSHLFASSRTTPVPTRGEGATGTHLIGAVFCEGLTDVGA
jgi:hypothetical protein